MVAERKSADQRSDSGKPGAVPALAAASGRKRPKATVKKSAEAARTPPGKIGGAVAKSMQFLREVRVELKKVTWPSRKQTVGSTVVVLVLVFIISIFLGGVDFILSSLFQTLLQ